MRTFRSFAFLTLWAPAMVVTACAPASTLPSAPTAANFVLASNAFAEGTAIPKKFSCDGENISPPLRWSGAPANTRSFALIMDDPDAPLGTFTHWVAFDIPVTQSEVAEGARSVGRGGQNGAGRVGYMGPCPPSGSHRYFFTLYALDADSSGVTEGALRVEVEKALASRVIAKAQLMGKYSR